jgi:hypothetical protein
MSDSLRRAIRTFVQAFTGVLALQAGAIIVQVNEGSWVPDIDWMKRVLLSALAAGVISLISFAQNWAEDNTSMPALLKSPASSGENPVPDPAPEVDRSNWGINRR